MNRYIMIIFISILLAGCPSDGDKGSVGPQGPEGPQGTVGPQGPEGPQGAEGPQGEAGTSCWDINSDGVQDAGEDVNGDGVWSSLDCQPQPILTQNNEAILNHQHFCEAFANLGQYPAGCPSASHVSPTGTLTLMSTEQFDGAYQTCSNLSIATKVNPSGGASKAYWSLDGAYIAFSHILYLTELNACESFCTGDPRCVAAHFKNNTSATGVVSSATCNIMYHSDTIRPYEQFCGIDISTDLPAAEVCMNSLGATDTWWAICP